MTLKITLDEQTNKTLDQVLFDWKNANFSRNYDLRRWLMVKQSPARK